jgi:hypothetical protein
MPNDGYKAQNKRCRQYLQRNRPKGSVDHNVAELQEIAGLLRVAGLQFIAELQRITGSLSVSGLLSLTELQRIAALLSVAGRALS